MQRLRLPLMALGLIVLATSCVMPDQISKIQKDLADVRAELNRVADSQAASQAALDEIRAEAANRDTTADRAAYADVESRLENEIARTVSINQQGLRETSSRFDRMDQEVEQLQRAARSGQPRISQPRPEDFNASLGGGATAADPTAGGGSVVSTPAGNPGSRPDPVTLYNTAYADYSKGNYQLAAMGFEEYHRLFPDNGQADNALYWVGECYYSQGDFQEAIRSFDRMLEAYPESDKAAAANLKKALAYQDQNQVRKAIVQFRFVVQEYPDSDEAKIARDRLLGLGAPA